MKNFRLLFLLIILVSILFPVSEIISQTYVGSNVCMGCHNNVNTNTGYNIWTEYMTSGHPYKLNPVNGAPPVYPANTSPGVPVTPDGTTWNDFTYVIGGYGWKARYVRPNGHVFTDNNTAQYNIEDGSRVSYNAGTTTIYNYNCFKCHTTGPTPTGSWNGVSTDSLGTFSEPGVRCEGCHGPGSLHIANPTGVHPPNSGEMLQITVCGTCHQRGGTTNNIPAGGGYIQHHEQINEMRASKHGDGAGAELTCASCHETHVPLRYPDSTPQEAIKANCQTCHAAANYPVLINGVQKSIDCVDCHMPPAGKSAIGKVVGNGRRGDVKTHIMAINVNPVDYTAMFNTGGTAVQLDGNGLAAVTLDFACLRCHTTETVDWAAPFAENIHTEGITTGVDDIREIPTSFALEQNFPNPFNPSTKINFALAKSEHVKLSIYSINGELIGTILEDFMPAGNHSINFEADGLTSGVYLYKLDAGSFSSTKKMVVLK